MEPESEALFSEVFFPEVKIEYDSDTSDSENERKWNAHHLTEGIVNEVCMPIIENDEVKFESSECANDQVASKLEEKCLSGSSNKDVSGMSDVSTPCSSSRIIPTILNSQNEHLLQVRKQHNVSSSSNVYNSSEIASQQLGADSNKNKKLFSCNICNRSFTLRHHLNSHHRTHSNERPYTCNICNKSFKDISQLKRHERTHTNERPYTCNICNKSFSGDLSRHLRTHTNEKPYTCSICNKSFKERSNLIAHLKRTHTNERPYACIFCNRAFTDCSYLKKHVRTHTNDRPYTCNICDKSFIDSGDLKRHLRTHTNERPYTCSICNRAFTQSGVLSKHMQTHRNK